MPHSGKTIPVLPNCWRTLTVKALAEGKQIPSEGRREIARRGVSLNSVLEGDNYDRTVWLFRLGFEHEQIAEALNLLRGTVRTFLSPFRGRPSEIIEEHLKGGRSATDIARNTNFAVGYVYQVLHLHGMKAHIHVAEPLDDSQKKDVLRRYRRGESVPIISEITGASHGQIKYLVKTNRGFVGYKR